MPKKRKARAKPKAKLVKPQQAKGQLPKPVFHSLMELQEFFQKQGSRGGKRAASRMSKAARVARARKAASASAKVRRAKARERRREELG